MATTRIMPLHVGKGRTESRAISDIIDYVANPKKTDNGKLITGYALWSSYRFAEKQREKIYVLDKGKSLMLALSQDLSQNRPAEAREHVRRFHELFFSLSPQKDAIEHNIGRALQLADKSAYHYYVDFAEKGYYNRLISGNINQVVHVDSVVCDFAAYPYKARTYARQLIIRETT